MRLKCLTSNILRYAASSIYSTFNRQRISRCPVYLHRVYSVKSDFKYSEKDKIKILAHLNQKTVNKLIISSAIDEFRAKSIIEHQKYSGEFQTLSDVLEVSGVGLVGLDLICEKILTDDKTESSNFFPKLDSEELSKINSIVGFDIDIGGLSWTLLDRNLNVIELSRIKLFGTQQFSHYGFKKKLEEMKENIPVADLYLIAKPFIRPIPQQFNRALAITTVETMLMTLLFSLDYNVSRCKHNTVGRFFNLSVGSEQTSGLFLMNQILKGESEHRCRFSSTQRKYYKSSSKIDQNSLTNSLLVALTYHSFFLSDFKEPNEMGDEYNIERVKIVDMSNEDCNLANVEPNTTVLRLGEKLKKMKEEALEKISSPKQKPSKLKGKKKKEKIIANEGEENSI